MQQRVLEAVRCHDGESLLAPGGHFLKARPPGGIHYVANIWGLLGSGYHFAPDDQTPWGISLHQEEMGKEVAIVATGTKALDG